MGLIEMNLALLILLIIGISLFINYLILLRTFFFKKTMVLLALEFLVSLIFAPLCYLFLYLKLL